MEREQRRHDDLTGLQVSFIGLGMKSADERWVKPRLSIELIQLLRVADESSADDHRFCWLHDMEF